MGILTSGDSLLLVPVFENYMLWAEESLSRSCVLCCMDICWGLCQYAAWHQARHNLIWLNLKDEHEPEHEHRA